MQRSKLASDLFVVLLKVTVWRAVFVKLVEVVVLIFILQFTIIVDAHNVFNGIYWCNALLNCGSWKVIFDDCSEGFFLLWWHFFFLLLKLWLEIREMLLHVSYLVTMHFESIICFDVMEKQTHIYDSKNMLECQNKEE